MELVLGKDNFEQEVMKSDMPVIVDFWASWCGPCRMLAPTIEEIAKEKEGSVKVGKVNIDDEEDLAVKYKIEVIPTVCLFKNGEIVKKSIGVATKEDILKEFGL